MSRLAVFLVCAATAVAASSAEARDGCGQGWFFNGVSCAPQERGYGPPQGYGYQQPQPRYYQEPQQRYYQERQYYDDGPRNYGGGGGVQIIRGRDGQLHCSHPKYTIQDGVCKPYRGG